ncbi:VOC family protein [Plantibacter sp. YIM 135347]|jgi:predicted enzyme related to lactoylglutathione lyase|uniref:VOC family protein n=1 Tax=Plantibacter sp. YIM 135347 TaxID=3423919 RepID=UPI003D345233
MAPSILPMILTADIPRLHWFYSSLLGAKVEQRTPEKGEVLYLGLRIGESSLGLVADANVDLEAPQRMLLGFDVADVAEVVSRVEAAGGTVRGGPNDMPWGQRIAHITDPDGNALNLSQDLPQIPTP